MTLDLTESQLTMGWGREYIKVYQKKGLIWIDITHEYTGNEDPELQYSSINTIFNDVIFFFISDYFENESTAIVKDIKINFLMKMDSKL